MWRKVSRLHKLEGEALGSPVKVFQGFLLKLNPVDIFEGSRADVFGECGLNDCRAAILRLLEREHRGERVCDSESDKSCDCDRLPVRRRQALAWEACKP